MSLTLSEKAPGRLKQLRDIPDTAQQLQVA